MGISFIGGIFSKIVEMSITAGIVILAVLLIRLLLKRAPKVFSYALWGIVLFRLLCPVSFSSPMSLLNFAELSEAAEQIDQIQENPVKSDRASDTTEHIAGDHGEVETVFAMLWLVGIGLLLAVNAFNYVRTRRQVASSMVLRDNVFISDRLDTPFCIGMIKPCIYLPSSLETEEREYIILHEQHHIKRGDHIIKVAAFLALCLHWFNPLVWLAFVLAGKDMEMSCDEAVLRKMDGDIRAEYSASLLHLATGKRIFAASPLAFGEGDPKQRIKHIMGYERPVIWLILGGVMACIAAFVILVADPEHIDLSEHADNSKLEQVIVYYPDGTQKLYSNPEHMDAVVDFMQSMKCHKSSADNRDGYGLDLEFVYSDGHQRNFVFHGNQKLSAADSITRMEGTEIYNEAVEVGWYKCSRDYSGELRELLESFLPEKVEYENTRLYIPTEMNITENDAEEYLPAERITEEPKGTDSNVTHHYYDGRPGETADENGL